MHRLAPAWIVGMVVGPLAAAAAMHAAYMFEGPVFNLLAFAAGLYLLHLWWSDTREAMLYPTRELRARLPGTTVSTPIACGIAALGAVAIIGFVTWFEHQLGLLATQRTLSPWFLGMMMGAAITEEIIFRGYLVIPNRGRSWLIASIIAFSLGFALLHPYLWTHAMAHPSGVEWITGLRIDWHAQGLVATASIFVLSLWFYAVRFARINPTRSLLPCFSAHAAANLAVFIIKLSTGHVA